MRELEAPLAALRAAWTAGRPAVAEAAPPAWRALAGSDGPAADLVLAALAGQALDLAFRPQPATPLAERPPLPRLALPTVPEAARPLARRVMAALREETERRRLIALLLARGHAMHPADWMPAASDEWLPDLYGPWLDWLRGEADTRPGTEAETLTEETWDSWPWRARLAALRARRRADPAAVRALITAKAPGEPAERRLQLLELVAETLAPEDAPLLAGFANDRSPRAQQYAQRLLARLTHGADPGTVETARELAEYYILRRVLLMQRLEARPIAAAVQRERRRALAQEASFGGLARALGLAETKLATLLPAAEDEAFSLLQIMAAQTGSAAVLPVLREQALDGRLHAEALRLLAGRLGREDCRHLALQALRREPDPAFHITIELLGPEAGTLALAPLDGPGLAAVLAAIPIPRDEAAPARQTRERVLATGLFRLAMLADAAAAAALLDRATRAGLSPADPRLDPLRLNVLLAPGTPP